MSASSALSRPLSTSTANTTNTANSAYTNTDTGNTLSGSPREKPKNMNTSPDRSSQANGHDHGGENGLPVPATAGGTAKEVKHSFARRLSHRALHTSPSFFSINMGTGISSILLHNFPYKAYWLAILGDIVFVLNVVIFVVLLFMTIYRHLKFKNSFRITLQHVTASMFWGCFPMGFVTIVNMVAFVCVPAWGRNWARLALGLWWIDVIIAIFINLGMVFVMFALQTHAASAIAPTLLLPIVSTVVAAASGTVVGTAMLPYDPALSRSTLYVSFIVWGTGVPLAMMVITIIMYKTITVGPPKLGAVMASFLPLGPCGQGSYGIVSMGILARKLVWEHNTPLLPKLDMDANRTIADGIYAGCLCTALVLWGLALCFYTLAFAQALYALRKNWIWLGPDKFHVGLWGITFPIGVWATATITLADELSSPALKVIAAFLSAQVIFHWLYVMILTVWTSVDGRFFRAPEIQESDGIVERVLWRAKEDRVQHGLTRHISKQDLEAGHTMSETAKRVVSREPRDHLENPRL